MGGGELHLGEQSLTCHRFRHRNGIRDYWKIGAEKLFLYGRLAVANVEREGAIF